MKLKICKKSCLGLWACILLLTALPGCGTQTQTVAQIPMGDYLSMTVTGYDNGINSDSGMTCQIWCYDIDTKLSTEIFDFRATAQYSLGYYDRSDQKVYYVERLPDESHDGYGDQIMVSDLISHKETQLTKDFFAVNYIIPVGERLYFVAAKQGDRTDRLGYIDLKTGAIQFWKEDGDTVVDGLTIDEKNQRIFATAYSIAERDYNVAHQGNDNYMIPLYTVYEIDMDLTDATSLYRDHHWLRSVMTCGDNIEILSDEKYNRPQIPTTIVHLDLNTNETSSFPWEALRWEGKDPNYSSDGNSIFGIITAENNMRGIGEYHCETQKTTLCIDTANGNFINNIYLVRENKDDGFVLA